MKPSRKTKTKAKSKPARKAKPPARPKAAAKPKKAMRPAPSAKPSAKAKPPAPKTAVKPPAAKAPAPAPPPVPVKAGAVKVAIGKGVAAKPGTLPAAGAAAEGPRPLTPKPAPKKSSRKGSSLRRGLDGNRPPGELLLPGGPKTPEEIQYMLRGCVAAERAAGETGIEEVLLKNPLAADPEALKTEVRKALATMEKRFESGAIEAQPPVRPPHTRRNFQGMVERAKMRRREIGAFLRGLHLAQQETSHMDAHGEASLDSLMQWAARLENLADAEEREQADYGQFHRILDQLESNTETLIVDVELTLRRLRDRVRA